MSFTKRILITGGCGAIGSELINHLKCLYKDTLFVNFDLLTYAGKKEHIEEPYDNYVLVEGDICDSEKVKWALDEYKPQYIFHLAAETHVDNSFGNSLRFTTTNVLGTHTLLECVKQYIAQGNDFRMFLHMSTDEVYGSVQDDEEPRREDAIFQPSNPYAASKAAAEMVCKSYERSFRLPIIIIRCNNAVSKYQHEEKLIPKIVNCMLNGHKFPVHGQGNSKRTFVHAYDIADAFDVIVKNGLIGSVYNIGTDLEYTVLDVIRMVVEKMLKRVISDEELSNYIQHVPDRVFQDYRYSIDSSALRALGWKEHVSMNEAIDNVLKKYHKNTFLYGNN